MVLDLILLELAQFVFCDESKQTFGQLVVEEFFILIVNLTVLTLLLKW